MRRTRLAVGGIERIKDDSRDTRGTILLETTIQDIRYAIRGLRARPAFTFGVTVTLGLGIGANATMFGIIDQLLFRSPAYMRDAARVHRVYLTSTSEGEHQIDRNFQYARYPDLLRESPRIFEKRLENDSR